MHATNRTLVGRHFSVFSVSAAVKSLRENGAATLCIREWLWRVRGKAHVYLRLCWRMPSWQWHWACVHLHIYQAVMLVKSNGCINCVSLNINHINIFVRFKGYIACFIININEEILFNKWPWHLGHVQIRCNWIFCIKKRQKLYRIRCFIRLSNNSWDLWFLSSVFGL